MNQVILSSEFDDFKLYDEMPKLDIPTKTTIVAICDLGLWNGRVNAYAELENNIKSIFNVVTKSTENYTYSFYCDSYNVKADLIHHDGTHHITFRKLKDDSKLDLVKMRIIDGKDVSRYTDSIRKEVCNAFGL